MAGSITVRDIALNADVSVATVSRVFNNRGSVTPELRDRVLKAANMLGYTAPTTPAKPTNNRPFKECGFLVYDPNMDDQSLVGADFWLHILHGVESEASRLNIKVVYRGIRSMIQTPQLLLNLVNEMNLNGILMVGAVDVETVQLLQSTGLPVVLLDNYIPQLEVDALLCDNFEGAKEAMQLFIQEGHTKIAFLGSSHTDQAWPNSYFYSVQQRLYAYQLSLLEAQLPVDTELIVPCNLLREGGYNACKKLLGSGKEFSAIFCANDFTAIGALKALREAGLRVPQDVSLIGFDDMGIASAIDPALTSVRFPKETLGAVGLRRLLARANEPDNPADLTVLKARLIHRESVAPYRKR
jgi:LacI family transcriptional regulator